MSDPDPHLPRPNRNLIYFGACIIAGLRLARQNQSRRVRDPNQRRGRGVYRTCTRYIQSRLQGHAEGDGEGALSYAGCEDVHALVSG
jgi:hypothetical protein